MKSTLISLIVISAFALTTLAQPPAPDTLWTKRYNINENDYGYCVQKTNDDGFVIAGTTHTNTMNDEVFLIKTDIVGNQLWSRTYGGNSEDEGYCVQLTEDGGYIIAGTTYSFGFGSGDVYLIKTDSIGNQQWYRTYGWGNGDLGRSVQQTEDGGYIMVGYTFSFPMLMSEVYLVKADSAGNQQWFRTFGGINLDYGECVLQTTDGGYIIAGTTESFARTIRVYVIKTDSLGNQQWQYVSTQPAQEYGKCVRQTFDGGYIIAGYTSFGAGGDDLYLIKIDSVGNFQWSSTYGGRYYDYGHDVQQCTDGGYILVGEISLRTTAGKKMYATKTDNLGNQLWQYIYDESSFGLSVQQTEDGGYIAAGFTYSYGAGQSDVYLIRLESESELLSISLSPLNPPITIPSTGGNFQFNGVVNNLGQGATVFDTWFNVSVPGMANSVNLLQRPNITLSVGGNLTRTLTQFVPGGAPAGTYIYRGFAGEFPNYVVDCDSFTFVKTP